MTATQAMRLIEESHGPESLFGSEDPHGRYRELAKLVHPDHCPGKRAEAAFKRLGEFYSQWAERAVSPVVIGRWKVGAPLAKGDICDLYCAEDAAGVQAVFKIARDDVDNDLMDAEYENLGILHREGDSHFIHYLPQVLETVEASGRRVNVFQRSVADSLITLEEVAHLVPDLDFRHVVWIGNRALSVLGFTHRLGVVHGAVFPEHLMLDAESHGLELVDWCYSVTAESGKCIPACIARREKLYPPEVPRKQVPSPATDIYLLMQTLMLVSPHVPKRFRPLVDYALASSPASRPGDAWEVQDRWRRLAAEEYGPPRFVKLEIPEI